MLAIAIGAAGLSVVYLLVRLMTEQNNARLREEFRMALESRLAKLEAGSATAVECEASAGEGTSQVVLAIAAATAAVGAEKVQIRPAKPQPAGATQEIWAQHGRAGVWSSHDIAQRWR